MNFLSFCHASTLCNPEGPLLSPILLDVIERPRYEIAENDWGPVSDVPALDLVADKISRRHEATVSYASLYIHNIFAWARAIPNVRSELSLARPCNQSEVLTSSSSSSLPVKVSTKFPVAAADALHRSLLPCGLQGVQGLTLCPNGPCWRRLPLQGCFLLRRSYLLCNLSPWQCLSGTKTFRLHPL